jgi:PAS domain S-box-containing protein
LRTALLILFILFCSFCSESQLFTFKNFNHKSGLSLSSILSISQDRNGFIWIGTDGAGLQRFDGKNVSSIKTSDENNEHHVSFIEPIGNTIYFSSRYYGFYKYEKNKINLLLKPKSFGEYLAIKKFKDNYALVGTRKIGILSGKKIIKEITYNKENYNDYIIQILSLDNSCILIGNKSSFFITDKEIIPLEKWLKLKFNLQTFKIGRFNKNKLELFNFQNQTKIVAYLNSKNQLFSTKIEKLSSKFARLNQIEVKNAFSKNEKIVFIDAKNEIYHYMDGFRYIPKNYSKQGFVLQTAFIDINNDYWLATGNEGVYKVSEEPFTKIELHSVYQNPLLSFIFRTTDNSLILSDYNGFTYLSSYTKPDFEKLNIRVYCQSTYQGLSYFATNKGIYVLKNAALIPSQFSGIKNKVIFILFHQDKLYFSEENKGLSVLDLKSNQTKKVIENKDVSHVYTAQLNQFQTKIYFGTNNGIFELNLVNKQLRDLNHKFKLVGSYSGTSTKDVYGNLWFTLDKQLIGITKRDEYISISDKKYFNSTLFYNLLSDDYGNLIVGTNKGITKLKIDENGRVKNSYHYNHFNGFEGYETHMRSNFKSGNIIYFGTIEGMFSLNLENLENLPNPPKPIVYQENKKSSSDFNSDEDLIKINFLAVNPKLKGIQYSYRLKGKSTAWSDLTNKTEAYFSNLSDQEYIFQVKSSFDGLNFSPIAQYKIVKQTPIWKSKWFILFLILSIAIANIIVLDRSKSFELSQIIENQNIEINSRIRSIILIFGFISVSFAHFLSIYVEKNLANLVAPNIAISIILFLLCLISISKNSFQSLKKYLLQIALFSILIHSYLSSYLSNIHPIYIIVISLCTALTPFILNKVKEVILFSVFHIFSAISIVFLISEPVYNEILFLIAVIVSVSLSIFTTYIRNESLQKLIFISGIVNKGNIIALAFNQANKITYISENSLKNLNINPNQFLGKAISSLNQFIFTQRTKHRIDFESIFQDEQKHIIPMFSPSGKEVWMEWSSQVFSKNIKVVFGQDVSERINLENNYESFIENAEDLIYTVDLEGKFLFVNSKFQEELDYSERELIGRLSLSIVGGNQQETIKEFYENQFRNRNLNTYHEFPIRKKDGSEIWVGQNTTLLYELGSTKLVKGFLALARDITQKREQQQLIENQNSDITSSINYAKKIQFNLLPSKQKFDAIFSSNEIYFKPKDIVSGDFYWLEQFDEKIIFVVGDCTGHGVPGAFMTLLGINLLNQVIAENRILDAGEILSYLDEKLVQILPRSGTSVVRDGMEINILVLDKIEKTINYACAGGKFITYNGSEYRVHRAESKHIGDVAESNFSKYNSYAIDYEPNLEFFFFTDGIQDQFGEISNKKFTFKRILDILEKNESKGLEGKIEELKQKFEIWKKNYEQTDDVTFIGFKI